MTNVSPQWYDVWISFYINDKSNGHVKSSLNPFILLRHYVQNFLTEREVILEHIFYRRWTVNLREKSKTYCNIKIQFTYISEGIDEWHVSYIEE